MKRKNYCYIFMLLLVVFIIDCSPPGGGPPDGSDYFWPKRLGGTGWEHATDIIRDHAGNMIIAGRATGDADLNGDGDTDDGGETASEINGNADIILVKFNPSGMYLWSKRLGGSGYDSGEGVAVDSSNNIYITGYIKGDADLNGDGSIAFGLPEQQGINLDGDDFFVTKFSSDGSPQWAKRRGGMNYDRINSIAVDSDDNILLAGYVCGDVDLNWDLDTNDSGESGEGFGGGDIIIIKFSSTLDFQWATRLGGLEWDEALELVIDNSSNILVTGHVKSNADLNGDGDTNDSGETPAACNDDLDVFIVKLNAEGTVQWAKRLGSIHEDQGYGLAANDSGDIFVTGGIGGMEEEEIVDADLNGDGDTNDAEETSGGCYAYADIFIVKFDTDGDFQWAERLGGMFLDAAFDMASNSNGDIFVTGLCGLADLNGDGDTNDSEETDAGCYGDGDVFVVKFDTDGGFQWAQRFGGSEWDNGKAITTDGGDKIFVIGEVEGDADLNGDGDTADINESGTGFEGSDIFIGVIDD
jgi:hypothetical protein